MKKLLVITLFLVACGSHSSNPIIGTPKKLGNIEIAEKDFPETMNWDAAIAACAKLGTGWRLPTMKELREMYMNKDKIGGFSNERYWSSTEGDDNFALLQNFNSDIESSRTKNSSYGVRAVRTY